MNYGTFYWNRRWRIENRLRVRNVAMSALGLGL